ncbi:MAG: DUF1501 domain-containing protein [Sphingobacteriales bacterium]|nr:DUF1501 domain-containing protein [Sphingobacteriales bacterium]MBI3720376.1 DUF1501 domain-containing protein [Sphingobacteriales bacterium]
MVIKRREFLQIGSLATATLMVPKFLKAFEGRTPVPIGNKVVVIIQLSGGNDGLNTIIPVRNDIYYRERPRLGIEKTKTLSLTDEAALHPALVGLKALYDDGSLAILNSVGYPNPDRSHFRSMDIWQTGSGANEYLTTGWIGRYLDAQCPPVPDGTFGRAKVCDKPTQALEIDDVLSLAMKGEDIKGLALKDPRRLYNTSHEKFYKDLNASFKDEPGEQPVDYLYKTMAETLSSADYIFQQSKLHPSAQEYPNTELGKNLKTIASLIFSEINTKVYYVSLGSFDTHFNQQVQQQNLFTQLSDAVTAFVKDLKINNRFDDMLLFTFSEFGRRVSQNASGGTDHGTANNMFLISGALKQKGIINALPDLTNLDEDDLKYSIDFKDVYATVLNKWLSADDKVILGKSYNHLSFV